jgi:uncharacterized protein (DUF486 family)
LQLLLGLGVRIGYNTRIGSRQFTQQKLLLVIIFMQFKLFSFKDKINLNYWLNIQNFQLERNGLNHGILTG